MVAGYTRQSSASIIPGVGIKASFFNAEYDAIQAAMDFTAGHNHDGTVGGGAPIPPVSLVGVTTNGIPVRTTSSTFVVRTLVAPGSGITITNPAGVAGDITFAL